MISKACVVGAYQRKLEEIATHAGVTLAVVVPPQWQDERGTLPLERAYTDGYTLLVEPMALNGNFHLHFYPKLARRFAEFKPDLVHIDEEPYNLAAWQALRLARRHNAQALFFSWQNLNRNYPFPFNAIENYVLRHAGYAICGNLDSQAVWQAKGYPGPFAVIPQFGIDPAIFSPSPERLSLAQGRGPGGGVGGEAFTIAFAGRFVPEKGADILIRAAARMEGDVCLKLIGGGPQQANLIRLATDSGLGNRIQFIPWMSSTGFPKFLHTIDALVLPSISRPNWKEQFGRVLVEAMACGVPVVGSSCGEIPNVVGDAGLIVPEGDVPALTDALRRLQANASLRADLSNKGRERALALFTHKSIAAETVRVYREMMKG